MLTNEPYCKVLPIFLWFQFHFTIITQDVTKKVSLKCDTLGVVCMGLNSQSYVCFQIFICPLLKSPRVTFYVQKCLTLP